MKRLSQIGWACACVALLTPATARAEPVSVSATAYEPSFVHYAVDRENAREAPERGTSLFALCHRCATPHAAPFIPSANLDGSPAKMAGSASTSRVDSRPASAARSSFPCRR